MNIHIYFEREKNKCGHTLTEQIGKQEADPISYLFRSFLLIKFFSKKWLKFQNFCFWLFCHLLFVYGVFACRRFKRFCDLKQKNSVQISNINFILNELHVAHFKIYMYGINKKIVIFGTSICAFQNHFSCVWMKRPKKDQDQVFSASPCLLKQPTQELCHAKHI